MPLASAGLDDGGSLGPELGNAVPSFSVLVMAQVAVARLARIRFIAASSGTVAVNPS